MDALVKKVRKGVKVHTFVPGQIPLSSQITVSERVNYVLDGAIVDVNASEWDLRSGEIGTVESIASEMQGKFRDYIMAKVFTALTTIWTASNTPNNFTNVGAPLTKTALDNMIKYLNTSTPGAKAIVGTRAALYPIMDFAGWDSYDSTNLMLETVRQEVFNTGWLGQYKGLPILVVPQQYDNVEDYNKMIPENKVVVLAQGVGEFITYGQPENSEYTDNQPVPPRRHWRLWQQFGMIIDNAQGIGVLQVTA